MGSVNQRIQERPHTSPQWYPPLPKSHQRSSDKLLPLRSNLFMSQNMKVICKNETLKQKYNQQLGKILEEMLHVYKVSAHALAQYGESHGTLSIFLLSRAVKFLWGPQSMRHDIAIAWRNIIHSSLELLNTSIKTGCLKQFDVTFLSVQRFHQENF